MHVRRTHQEVGARHYAAARRRDRSRRRPRPFDRWRGCELPMWAACDAHDMPCVIADQCKMQVQNIQTVFDALEHVRSYAAIFLLSRDLRHQVDSRVCTDKHVQPMAHVMLRASPRHANLVLPPPSSAALEQRAAHKASVRLADKCCPPSDRRVLPRGRDSSSRSRHVRRSWLTEPISTQQPVDPHPTLHNEGGNPLQPPSKPDTASIGLGVADNEHARTHSGARV